MIIRILEDLKQCFILTVFFFYFQVVKCNMHVFCGIHPYKLIVGGTGSALNTTTESMLDAFINNRRELELYPLKTDFWLSWNKVYFSLISESKNSHERKPNKTQNKRQTPRAPPVVLTQCLWCLVTLKSDMWLDYSSWTITRTSPDRKTWRVCAGNTEDWEKRCVIGQVDVTGRSKSSWDSKVTRSRWTTL